MRIACRHTDRQAGWQAGRSAGRLAGQRVYVRTHLHSREPTRWQTCRHSYGYNHSLNPSYILIPILLLGSLGIGKRCFESQNNNTCSNPFIDGFLVLSKAQTDFLCSQKHSKVSFGLPEGFSVTAEKWQQQGMF